MKFLMLKGKFRLFNQFLFYILFYTEMNIFKETIKWIKNLCRVHHKEDKHQETLVIWYLAGVQVGDPIAKVALKIMSQDSSRWLNSSQVPLVYHKLQDIHLKHKALLNSNCQTVKLTVAFKTINFRINKQGNHK